MKSIQEFLSYLSQLDIKLWVDGVSGAAPEELRLRCNAPKGILTPDLRTKIAESKAEIIFFLQEANLALSQTVEPIRPVPRDGNLTLSFPQQQLWFLDQLEEESVAYNGTGAVRLAGSLDVVVLQQAIVEIIGRHEILRTNFKMLDGSPVQVIAPIATVTLPVIDLQALPEQEQSAEVQRLVTKEQEQPFDLSKDPLMRVTLLQLTQESHILLLTMHHIVSDGWSIGIFIREFSTLYQAFCAGVPSPLPELSIQYADFAVWQRQWLSGEVLETQLNYWQQQLAGAPPLLELPTDRLHPPIQTFRGGIEHFEINRTLTQQLKNLSQHSGATLFMTMLAAFVTLLYRYSGQSDIVVGSPIANRNHREIESLIGLFVNTLVLRTNLEGNPSFLELLNRVQQVALEAYAHQDLPFEQVVEALQPERNLSHSPLFQVMFALQNAPMGNQELPGLTINPIEMESITAKFDLTVSMEETQAGLTGKWEYNRDLFDAVTITRMAGHFQTLIEAIVANPQQRLSDLPLLTVAEKHQLLVEWNNTQADYPQDQCIHQLFEAQVEQTPDAVAVVFEDQQLTYRQLNCRANRVARLLIEQGVSPGTIVTLLAERSINFLTAMIAVFKTGGAYLPLDSHHPDQRLHQVLEQSQTPLVLAAIKFEPVLSQALANSPDKKRPQILFIEELLQQQRSEENLPVCCTPMHLAYVIYTSGSTGVPKGAMVEHRGMLNHLYAKILTLKLTDADKIAQTARQSFDISVWQFLAALLVGGQVHIFNDEVTGNPPQLLEQLERQGVSILEIVPSLLRITLEEIGLRGANRPHLSKLRWLLLTGEALPPQLCSQWLEYYPTVPMLNAYGPTECSDDVTHYPIYQPLAARVLNIPIGLSLTNMQLYVLGFQLQPVPIGVPGELYIGGIGVGRGYLNRPELTAEKFIPNPFSQETGTRLYKTGDLGRYLPDGNIEFLGRVDHQVKIRGFRIELGEIEAVLSQHLSVQDTIVLAREDMPEHKRLVAYVVQNPQYPFTNELVSQLRTWLTEKLPNYMIPSAFVQMEALPLTHNGKVDRQALPVPDWDRLDLDNTFIAPNTQVEKTLAGIWADLLVLEQIGIYDNFFELGGNSLLAIQVISRLREAFQVELPLRRLFEFPTVAELSKIIEAVYQAGEMVHKPIIEPVTRDGNLPLSFAQARLWFLDKLERGSTAYNMPAGVHLIGTLHLVALEQSLTQIIGRHEILRTNFKMLDGSPVQVIAPIATVTLPVIDLQALPEQEQSAEVQRLVTKEQEQPFDLSKDPLMRVTLLQLTQESHILLLTMHHIVSDGWSIGIFIREFSTLYQAFCAGVPSPLPELSIQYADFAVWQRQWLSGEVLETQLNYWQQQLAGAPPLLELPTDRLHPPIQTFRGGIEHFEINRTLTQQLKNLSQHSGATLFMTMLAAFVTLLYRYSGQSDIVVGSPIANRNHREIESLIGLFVNTLVLRTNLEGNPSFLELLNRVQQVALEAYAHQDLPFEQVVEALQPERNLSHSPLFQVMFALQNAPMGNQELPGLTINPIEMESITAKFDLTVSMEETQAGLTGKWEYNRDLFDAVTITRMAGHFQTLIEAIVANPQQRLSDLPLLTVAEKHQLLVEWNNTQADYPQDQCIHQLFEAQVEQTPDAVAVVFEDQQLTYRQLNCRANQVAHHLQYLGIEPNMLVGICMDRSLEMVVGLLGILKTGGAYVPLDPDYPQQRLAFIQENAQVQVLLTQQRLVERLPEHEAVVVCLDTDWYDIAQQSENNQVSSVTANNLAYVIYTSGSTGKPKGVMVAHGNVVNFFTGMDNSIGCETPSTWLAVTSISFDISVLEILWTLTRGFQVVVQANPVWATYDTEPINELIDKEMAFSLFYFASDELQAGVDKYQLLLEGAKFADQHEFSAIWTPERHFHAFGGLYPNPSVVSAAIAMITERIQIRAGSVVLPLQHPVRVAEEWSVVDNLSQGRVAVSFASGWHADDFVLAPENYSDRFQIMFRDIETVRKLWRGESIKFSGGSANEVEVKIHPQPIQPELPIWITAAGSPETFRKAGEIGANVLTHLLGQSIEELQEKIGIYRSSWEKHGHQPGGGHVTLMLHTFVGEDIDFVREKVRQPFCQYLKSSLDLLKNLGRSLGQDIDAEDFTAAEEEQLLDYAFNRYFERSSLFGTPSTCLQMINRLKVIGVDEVACLIDFGVDLASVMSSLHKLDVVKKLSNKTINTSDEDYSLPAQITRYNVSHMQCTPSLARMLTIDPKALGALGSLRKLMLGGEALPVQLAEQISEAMSGEIHNMYGPTETTIWSTTHSLGEIESIVPIGRPIANTNIYILDQHFQLVPIGVPGELFIGGAGVVQGYLNQPDLTAERFIPNPFSHKLGTRLYKTGDLACYLSDGNIDFLGRIDHQVKIRGVRIELGEIEAVLSQYPGVRETVVLVREDLPGNQRLVAYVAITHQEVAPTISNLQSFLQQKLPAHMVPANFVLLDVLPLTANGKINRQALPAPDSIWSELEETFVAPRTPVEEAIAEIWAQILGVKQVGIHDNFFNSGGHSLMVTQVVYRLSDAFCVELPLRSLFESPTVASLAVVIVQRQLEQTNSEAITQLLAEMKDISEDEVDSMLAN